MTLNDLLTKHTPVFLAPMAGITDAPFRDLVRSFGATAVVSEMVSSEAMIRNSEKTLKRLVQTNKDSFNIVQIVGCDPINMAESAKMNEDIGADVIDINMGCPARKIVSSESGSALMKNEDLAVKIVSSVVNAVKIPVTLKMRLGWDSEHINCFSLAKKFEESGIKMLSIHCRTRNQMYSGSADWDALCNMKNVVKIPYLCNGDIKTTDDAVNAMQQSLANGVMIGRGALGRPWLLNQIMKFLHDGSLIPSPSLEEQCKIVMSHFENTLDFYGTSRGIKIFRKHFCWYSAGMNGASIYRQNINVAEDVSFIKNYVECFYEKNIHLLS